MFDKVPSPVYRIVTGLILTGLVLIIVLPPLLR